jgi:O-antigen ligase
MFWRPIVGVCLVLIFFPLNPWYFGCGLQSIRFVYISTICLILAYLVNMQSLPKPKRAVSALSMWLLAAWILWCALSLAWTVDKQMTWDMVVVMTKQFIFLFLIMRIVTTMAELEAVAWSLFIAWGLKAYFARGDLYGVRGDLLVGFVGTALVLFVPAMFYSVVNSKKKWQWIVGVMLAPYILDCIIWRARRSSFASLVVAGGLVLLFTPRQIRWRARLLAIGAVLFFIYVISPPTYWDKMRTILNPRQEASAASRYDLNEISYKIIQEHPLGIGLGCYSRVSPSYGWGGGTGWGYVAHNSILSVWAETGWIGGAIWTAAMFAAWLNFVRVAFKSPRGSKLKVLSTGFAIGMVSIGPSLWTHTEHLADYHYWMIPLSIVALRVLDQVREKQAEPVLEAEPLPQEKPPSLPPWRRRKPVGRRAPAT